MPLEPLQTLLGHNDRIWTLAWNPKGSLLASSGGDKSIRLWAEGADGNWKCASILTESHSKSIRRVCWSPCGQYIASASFDATVCIWKRNHDGSWSVALNLEGHENEVKSVAWSHDGNYLASCGRDRTVWIWERAEIENENQLEDEEQAELWDCSDVKNDHTKDVKHIVWHPNHNILVSCSYDDTVKFFHKQGDDWKCYETLASHTSTVWSAGFSASGEYLATSSEDKTVRIWKNKTHDQLPNVSANSWKCVSVIQGYHKRTIYDVSWCKLSDVIVSASGDNSLVFYAKSSENSSNQDDIFACIDKFGQSHNCDINSVSWNQNQSGLLASAGDDCLIKLWRYSSEDKGMKPPTIVDEIINQVSAEYGFKVDSSNHDKHFDNSPTSQALRISEYLNLQNLIQLLQLLQNEIRHDEEKKLIEDSLDLKIENINPHSVEISNLYINENNMVEHFTVVISNGQGNIEKEYKVLIDNSGFNLQMPKRSVKFLTVAKQLFLLDKTGDLFRINSLGESQFLLGHLSMFSDIRFVTEKENNNIKYIISADRDEKIRLSNYPNSFNIERYCFGHRHFIRRILLVDEKSFVSIDVQNNVCLWDLSDLTIKPDCYIQPKRTVPIEENTTKKVRHIGPSELTHNIPQ